MKLSRRAVGRGLVCVDLCRLVGEVVRSIAVPREPCLNSSDICEKALRLQMSVWMCLVGIVDMADEGRPLV